MVAEDEDGNVATASANVTVLADGRPEVEITSPSSGDLFWTTDTISFQGTVIDDLTEPDRLHVQWQSDIDGVLLIGSPDSSGFTAAGRQLSEGTHTVTLTAIDEEANEGSDSIVVVVQDPLNVDDDGDGYTENEGDCDDGDASRSPGEPEVCDEVDNNCDGRVNESFEDSYEPDDSIDAAYDLGVVDGEILWTGSSISLSGLTLHGPDDEDWFTWDAADEFLLDNVDIQVRATGLPSSGNFTLQLWMRDGSTWVMKDSDSGYGALTVTATGDLLDDSEDFWAIAFFANTWPSGSCAQVYEIQIES
ncbi:MAG: hypothetical protein D6798_06470 [Deltaproteobacteria bacterium]|nr:MAG: hypothetical protein D6798_06470 [Deltaproteobacteria bacterium]